jgi:hypothetical protein
MHYQCVRNRDWMLTISRKEEFNKEILTPFCDDETGLNKIWDYLL